LTGGQEVAGSNPASPTERDPLVLRGRSEGTAEGAAPVRSMLRGGAQVDDKQTRRGRVVDLDAVAATRRLGLPSRRVCLLKY
jgi:hypothetical protein